MLTKLNTKLKQIVWLLQHGTDTIIRLQAQVATLEKDCAVPAVPDLGIIEDAIDDYLGRELADKVTDSVSDIDWDNVLEAVVELRSV